MFEEPSNSGDRLKNAYHAWRDWTEREGAAIQAGDWDSVSRCQQAKRQLQSRILEFTDAVRRDSSPGAPEAAELDRQVRSLVADLIRLESRNEQWLADQRRQLEARRDQLNETDRNLRRVQSAYGNPKPNGWGTYS